MRAFSWQGKAPKVERSYYVRKGTPYAGFRHR